MTDQQLNNPNQWPWSPNFEEEIYSPIDILIFLARQIKIILITPTIFCTFTIIYVLFFAKPVYTSNSKIMILNASGMSQTAALAAQFGVTFPDSKAGPNWAISEIIYSRTLARVILEQKYDTEEFGPQKTLLQIMRLI